MFINPEVHIVFQEYGASDISARLEDHDATAFLRAGIYCFLNGNRVHRHAICNGTKCIDGKNSCALGNSSGTNFLRPFRCNGLGVDELNLRENQKDDEQ